MMNPDELARLEEERNFLLDSLRDVERERAAGDIDDDDYATLKSGYTQRAADVLKAIEAGQSMLKERAPKSRAKAIVVSCCVVLFACVAGWLVAAQSGQRLPGQTSSGGIEDSTASLLSQARAINFSDPQKAIEFYNQVVKLDPDNSEAVESSMPPLLVCPGRRWPDCAATNQPAMHANSTTQHETTMAFARDFGARSFNID